jgi:hypothetical protein
MKQPKHVDTCQRCRLTHRHVQHAMHALRSRRGLEALIQLSAALDTLVAGAGCDRAWRILEEAAAEARIQLEPRQRPLFKPPRR